MKKAVLILYRQTRKFVVTIVGFTVLLIGIILIVAPGPAIVVIPIALAILATEFVWARNLLKKIKNEVLPNIEKRRNKKK